MALVFLLAGGVFVLLSRSGFLNDADRAGAPGLPTPGPGATARAGDLQGPAPLSPAAFTSAASFSLRQSDGPGCAFSGAPLTGGSIDLRLDFNTGSASGTLRGSGSGTRAGLRCGANTGDLVWSQSYSASLSGSLNPATGAVSLSGTLSGSDGSSWRNCRTNGNPTACPVWGAGPYAFPVRLTGTVDRAIRAGRGTITVSNINLATSGTWSSN
jgi:hypothetical protein